MPIEKIPSVDGKELFPYYYSSSLAEIVDATDQVLDDMRSVINTWSSEMRIWRAVFKVVELPNQAIDQIRGRAPLRSALALFYVSLLRHDPKEDPKDKKKILIKDVTDELEVMLPNELQTQFINEMGGNMNPTLVRGRLWTSDVLLLGGYSNREQYGQPNTFTLVNVINRHVTEAEREEVYGFVRKFAAQGIGLTFASTLLSNTLEEN